MLVGNELSNILPKSLHARKKPPPPCLRRGSGIACWLEHWTGDCEFESRQGRRENFLLQGQLCVLTLIQCPFHPVLPKWHVKDPSHSGKSAGGRLHLNTHTSLTQRSQSGLTMLAKVQLAGYT